MSSPYRSTVITYRAPASYRGCGDVKYETRNVRYVSTRRSNNYNEGGTQYVAVRSYAPRTRYVAVRNVALDDDDLRYVPVRRDLARPEAGVRYVAVRSGHRRGNGIVAYVDDEAPRYVAVRRAPTVNYVAVPSTRYVAVRNGRADCACFGAEARIAPVKRVVVRTEDRYPESTKYVAVRNLGDDDDDDAVILNDYDEDDSPAMAVEVDDDSDIDQPSARINSNYVEYAPVAYPATREVTYISANDMSPCAEHVALRNCSEHVGARTISYVPDDEDFDDTAYLDDGGVTYVAADDVGNACMSSMGMDTVSYVPVEEVDDHAFQTESATTYAVADDTAPLIRHIEVSTDAEYVNAVNELSGENIAACNCDGNLGTDTLAYVPAEETQMSTVSYVPANHVEYVAADDDALPMQTTYVTSEPIYFDDNSALLAEEGNDVVADLNSTARIAGDFGYRDGFEDGRDAALEGDVYHPENSGDFEKATEGYEDEYGSKDVYKDAYRTSYLDGYRAGFDSAG